MDLHNLTIEQYHKSLAEKQFSVAEATKEFYGRIEEKDKDVHAFLSLRAADAMREAEQLDRELAEGGEMPKLFGVPLAIKDNLLLRGTKTTAASKMLANYESSYDATVLSKLQEHKAVMLGKTNLDEFAMGSSTENSAFGPTRNPLDLERVPGGSSGGSAAAVAADMALGALGSDTGGSIRQPAAFCGIVGLKPTYGAVSRYGAIALASSLDQVGPFAKTAQDAATLFKAIAGKDPLDGTSREADYSNVDDLDEGHARSLKIGVPKEYFADGIADDVARSIDGALARFKKAGFDVREVSLPHTRYALSCYYIILPAEASSNLARYDGIRYARVPEADAKALLETYRTQRGIGFGPETVRRILLGTFVLSSGYYDAYYAKAQKVRRLILNDFAEAFKEVDALFTPTTPTGPFKFGEKASDPLAMYMSDIMTIPANLAGVCALSMPADAPSDGTIPAGFQLIGKHWHERDILSLGHYYETNLRNG
jgi:aspartyl-tRNA(Asn)/glutamyl-tRNA(Gln) amidotransferase subunit A